jgi:hypothetical protein
MATMKKCGMPTLHKKQRNSQYQGSRKALRTSDVTKQISTKYSITFCEGLMNIFKGCGRQTPITDMQANTAFEHRVKYTVRSIWA